MKTARKLLMSAQRRAIASSKNNLMDKIMQSSQDDIKLFHRLIRNQRNNSKITTDVMVFNDKEENDPENILKGWNNYFEHLHKCVNEVIQHKFCTEKFEFAKVQNYIIEQLEVEMNEEIDNTNEEEIQQTVRKLKTGKSPGTDGISAEHLKHMPSELIPYLINIINLIFMEKDVPQGVKEGVLTPVLKNGKDRL